MVKTDLICPACKGNMSSQTLDGHYGRQVTLDLCKGCNGLWFDGMESHQLTPGSTLALFKLMGDAVKAANRPLVAHKTCPRCRKRLSAELDRQRTTTFEAFRCPAGHGRYMTFGSFLRAKNFVRDLSPAEVDELRRHVKMIRCARCGASIDIRTESSCSFCRAPLAMLDPQQLETTLVQLQEAETRRTTPDPTLALRLAHERLTAERAFAEIAGDARRSRLHGRAARSLVDSGIRSFVSLIDLIGY